MASLVTDSSSDPVATFEEGKNDEQVARSQPDNLEVISPSLASAVNVANIQRQNEMLQLQLAQAKGLSVSNNEGLNNVAKWRFTKPRKKDDIIYIHSSLKPYTTHYNKEKRKWDVKLKDKLNDLPYKDMIEYVNNSINEMLKEEEEKVVAQMKELGVNDGKEDKDNRSNQLDQNNERGLDLESRITEHLSKKFVETHNDPRKHYDTYWDSKAENKGEPLRCFKQKQIKPKKCAENWTATDAGYCLEIFVQDFMNSTGCPVCGEKNCFVGGGTKAFADCICRSKKCQGKTYIEAKSKWNNIKDILRKKKIQAGSYISYIKQCFEGVNHYLFLFSRNAKECIDFVYLMKIINIHPCITNEFCSIFEESKGKIRYDRIGLKSVVEWDKMEQKPLYKDTTKKHLLKAIDFADKACKEVKDIVYPEEEIEFDLVIKGDNIGLNFDPNSGIVTESDWQGGLKGDEDDDTRRSIAIGDKITKITQLTNETRPVQIHIRRKVLKLKDK
eukprot:g5409.t1